MSEDTILSEDTGNDPTLYSMITPFGTFEIYFVFENIMEKLSICIQNFT